MNRSAGKYLVLAILCFGIKPLMAASTAPEVFFQEAMLKETGERDPEAAIPLYQKAIDEAGTDRQLRFKARFRMAGCYELLGKSKDAEQVYLQIIGESASTSSEMVQEALASLRRLQAQEKAAAASSAAPVVPQKPLVLASHYEESRFSFSVGAAALTRASELQPRGTVDLRARILPGTAPLSLYVEAGAITPGGNPRLRTENKISPFQNLDQGVLELQYQTHLALISELPHGHERWVIPEGGVGIALTSTRILVESTLAGDVTSPVSLRTQAARTSLNPYFSAGLHFFPDRVISIVFQGSYIACPNPDSVSIPAQGFFSANTGTIATTPSRTQTFNFPSSFWDIELKLQFKFGQSKLVLEQGS